VDQKTIRISRKEEERERERERDKIRREILVLTASKRGQVGLFFSFLIHSTANT
jgi:hypothetical protein